MTASRISSVNICFSIRCWFQYSTITCMVIMSSDSEHVPVLGYWGYRGVSFRWGSQLIVDFICKYSASTVWATDPTTSRVHRHKVRGQEVYWRRLVRGQVQDGLWLSQLAFLRRGWDADLIVLDMRIACFNHCAHAFILGDVKLTQPIAIMRHICRKHGNGSLLGKSELEWRRIDQLQEQCNDFRMIFCESICYNPHFVSTALRFDDNNMRHEILSRYLV